jgi:hypothetical protein
MMTMGTFMEKETKVRVTVTGGERGQKRIEVFGAGDT